jgi:protein phosphatase
MGMVESGNAFCLPGNHDVKLAKKLNGRNVAIAHGLAESLEQLERESDQFKQSVAEFIDRLASHLIFDTGNLVVAHAGMKESLQGKDTDRVRSFALYGQTTGQTDEYGLPIRAEWAREYEGSAMVVYGHTPVAESKWINGTINIDNGCVFGGKLTALRYPEKELISVPAIRTYCLSPKPLV